MDRRSFLVLGASGVALAATDCAPALPIVQAAPPSTSPTTAGSLALVGHPTPKDAPLVAKLRAAGAVILAKANLSEWANIRSTRSTSGWSAPTYAASATNVL